MNNTTGYPLVSIVTPCYNGEKYLKRFFDSILSQTYPNIELVFINDGSTDDTERIALEYASRLEEKNIIYKYLTQSNAGQAVAVNKGIKKITGDYFTWPDADDLMSDDCIEIKVRFLEAHPEFGLCICRSAIVRDGNLDDIKGIMERNVQEGQDDFFEDMLFLRNVYFCPGGYMVRTSALRDSIPDMDIFDGRGGQNAQILLPVLHRYRCGYIKDLLNKYIIRGESHSHQINTPEKEVEQNQLFEMILLETLKRISEEVYEQYQLQIRRHYGHIIFGNAIDSGNRELIKHAYYNLKGLSDVSFRERLLYAKHYLLNKNRQE